MKLRSGKRNRGAALILAILLLGLLVALLVAMLGLSGTEQQMASGDLERSRARQLAATAMSLAVAQVRGGTEAVQDQGQSAPWTSQPGAIRVHAANGDLQAIHKLYSAERMVAGSEKELADDLPADWPAFPGEFVDLNAPRREQSISGQTTLTFPIVDPRAARTTPEESAEGFGYENSLADTVSPGAEADAQRLPMPVRWLYVLHDGSLGTIHRGTWTGSEGRPTESNPIVGRIAFWTDDESCKININTASEGVYWDTPRFGSREDLALARYQPTAQEFQRHPAHPSSVSLSSVLFPNQRFHAAGSQSHPRHSGSTMHDLDQATARGLWALSPMLSAPWEETSGGGRRVANLFSFGASNPQEQRWPGFRYPSLDSLTLGWNQGSQEFFQRHPESRERLRQGRFFLTTDSAAPELTLFGTPRVALWPVHVSPRKSTAFDAKIALAASVGQHPYFLHRRNPANGFEDMNQAAAGRNRDLYRYLQALTSRPFPGFAASAEATFALKYGPDREQILLSMLDHVRSANFNDGQLEETNQFCIVCGGNPKEGYGQVAPLAWEETSQEGRRLELKGLGRLLSVSEVALVFSCRAVVGADGKIQGSPSARHRAKLLRPGDREMEVSVLVEGFVPGQGFTDYRPYVSASFGGLAADNSLLPAGPALRVCGGDLVLGENRVIRSRADLPTGWQPWGGGIGCQWFSGSPLAFESVFVSGETKHLSFSGGVGEASSAWALAVYDDPASAGFSAGKDDLAQIVPLHFPPIQAGALRLPELPPEGTPPVFAERWQQAKKQGRTVLTQADVIQSLVPAHGDFRLVAAARVVGQPIGRKGANANHPVFVGHPGWGRQAQAHSLREPGVTPQPASYFADLTCPPEVAPDFPIQPHSDQQIPVLVHGQASQRSAARGFEWNRLDHGARASCQPAETGDFDNANGPLPDGPYTNRPDDGDTTGYAKGTPYFSAAGTGGNAIPPAHAANFIATRMMPGPVAFGSLPTGVQAQVPWQTLLFRPAPPIGHFGAASPPDHLFLDLFWMPIVEPRPLSVPLETEGKINLNHLLVPFRHIHRATALHALFKAEKMAAIPDEAAATYKANPASSARLADSFRHYIDSAETLRLWDEEVFSQGRVFLSASEVCRFPLIPEGQRGSRSEMQSFWARHRLTGDNLKERPYAHLHPRLTTRSNVFRVHFLAQSLKKGRGSRADIFDPAKDRVTAEVSGSALIRRRIDFQRENLPDHAGDLARQPGQGIAPLDHFYSYSLLKPIFR